jgi:SAM-dependent methyltransferase
MPTRSYAEYLAAKKTVDDRGLNSGVLAWVTERLHRLPAPARVIEIGAGLGTMPARLVELGALFNARYVLVDSDAELLADARTWLEAWSSQRGLCTQRDGDTLIVSGEKTSLALTFQCCDVDRLLDRAAQRNAYDLLIANAVLDLVDASAAVPRLLGLLAFGGAYWFSVNFDGETIFLPEHPNDLQLMRVYHRSMDERVRDGRCAGDSRTGRHLFGHLRAAGARIARAGSSDWVVFAEDGRYPADEAKFLRHILRTIEGELQRHADVDRSALAEWIELRTAQLQRGELVYIAHQLDFAGEPR